MATIVGDRVYLRPLESADINNGWLEWINDYTINQYLGGSFPVTYDALLLYYKNSQPPEAVMFAICLKESDKYIGNARLSEINFIHRHCKYGRLIGDENYRAKGYGSEALILLLRYGFHNIGMNRIYSAAISDNEISLASNEKVGMKREGTLRNSQYKNGRFYDMIMLAMLRSEFDELYPP